MESAAGYLDESGHVATPGYYAIGGFYGTNEQWDRFVPKWLAALVSCGARDLHMRDFAHSQGEFKGWTKERRIALMQGLTEAIVSTDLVSVGAALRTDDFNSLNETQRSRFQDPYFVCFQEVVAGFGIMGYTGLPSQDRVTVVASRQDEYRHKARQLYAVMQKSGRILTQQLGTFMFANMRGNPALQAADLLAYELTKELSNQDNRPDDEMRWPFYQIQKAERAKGHLFIKFLTRDVMVAQAELEWQGSESEIMRKELDQMTRVYRDLPEPIKGRLRRLVGRSSEGFKPW